MIEVATAYAVVQGVGLVVKGIKEAANLAREAFDEVNEAVESGKNLAESMSGVTKFFSAAGKYETQRAQLEEAKVKQEEAVARGETVADHMSDAEYVMEMMAIDRQIKQYYDDIKHLFTYHFQEPGMWNEFWQRMGKLRADREAKAEAVRRAEMEKRLAVKAAEMAKRRKKQEMWQLMENTFAVIVGVIVSAAIIYGIVWMFKAGGNL